MSIIETGKKVFLTGVTGFVGMAVLEKLLRDQYNEIDTIYVLIRASRGVEPKERLEQVFANPLFDGLRKAQYNFGEKVVSVEGDISQPGLGLSEESRKEMADSVETIIHCAASIEFCLPLKDAFDINTMGIVRLLELADKCGKLNGIVHVSTAYVNSNIKDIVIEEKVYPITLGDPDYLIANIPLVDQTGLDSLEKYVLKEFPNTYTFTKALAEHALVSRSGRWNIAIVRPSIITSAIASPTPGWMHGLAAITGITTLVGLGVAEYLPVQGHGVVDVIPVDYVAGIVVGAASVIKHQSGCKVYHATSSCINPLTWGMYRTGVLDGWKNQPKLEKSVGPVSLGFEPDLAAFDLTVKATRKRLMSATTFRMNRKDPVGAKKVMNLVGKVDSSYTNFLFFGVNQWIFKAHNVIDLEANQNLPPDHVGRATLATMDWQQYFHDFTNGIRIFVLEKKSNQAKEKALEQATVQTNQSNYVAEPTSLNLKA